VWTQFTLNRLNGNIMWTDQSTLNRLNGNIMWTDQSTLNRLNSNTTTVAYTATRDNLPVFIFLFLSVLST
jgi:hypothetical protein